MRATADPSCTHSGRSEEHTSELQSLITISYAVFCLKKKNRAHGRVGRCLVTRNDQQTDRIRVARLGIGGGRPRVARAARIVRLLFFFNDTATTEIYTVMNTLSLHDALPISARGSATRRAPRACLPARR